MLSSNERIARRFAAAELLHEAMRMKRDFALRIDSLLGGVRSSLDAVVEYMRHHIQNGDISDEEFKKYVHFIGKSLVGTIEFSNDLYRLFPDITPDELKGEPPKSN
jgi:hypothetical protein